MPRRLIAIWCLCLIGWQSAAFAQAPWETGGMPPGGSTLPASWPDQSNWAPPPGGNWISQASCPPYYTPSAVHAELVPDHTQYGNRPDLDLTYRDLITDAWCRFEYLNWTIQPPENELLGAPMLTQDPRELFPAIDRVTGVRILEFSFVPDTEEFDLRNLNGLRGTFGLPTRAGTLEVSSFVLQQGSHDLSIAPRFDPLALILIYPAMTLLDNGVPSDTDMILFDTSYNAELRSQMFGADASFVLGPYEPNVPMLVRPTFGAKYVQFYEDFSVRGRDFGSSLIPTDHVISAKGHNNFITATGGLRIEAHHEFLTLGFEPKLMLGVNRHEDSVRTEEIYSAAEAPNLTGEEDTDFAAGLELQAYAKIHINEHFTVFGGYNALFLTNVARPFDMIRYNDAGLANPPDIVFEAKRETMTTHGITVGGEFYFWE